MADSSKSALQVADIYDRVMEDVVSKMTAPFRDEGVDEATLNDLKLLWMEKLSKQGTVVPQAPPSPTGAGGGNFYPHTKGTVRVTQLDGGNEDSAGPAEDDEILGSADDEDDEEDDDDENFIICQYEKVTRSKNKYKVVFRSGIMQLNGTEYMFDKAEGSYSW
eukprot:m.121803 g.121803  ORF g.121803 m.121803 type:complete len:163 (+) comp14410_c0_seq1:82-570(+)